MSLTSGIKSVSAPLILEGFDDDEAPITRTPNEQEMFEATIMRAAIERLVSSGKIGTQAAISNLRESCDHAVLRIFKYLSSEDTGYVCFGCDSRVECSDPTFCEDYLPEDALDEDDDSFDV